MNRTARILSAILSVALVATLFAGCGGKKQTAAKSGVEDGVLTVAMECAYAPYNWTQSDDSNGAVKIKDSNDYANGYDIMMAKKICEANNWKLEVVRLDWDSLVPAVQTGKVDATIAGQSMTEDRMQQVDFAGPYIYASIVCMAKKDSKYASATKLSNLSGGKCTSQLGTIWYDTPVVLKNITCRMTMRFTSTWTTLIRKRDRRSHIRKRRSTRPKSSTFRATGCAKR